MAKTGKQCHLFFKLFLPEFSSKQLDLPPAFLMHFAGTFPKDAKLKDHSGKLWPVNLEESEKSLTITNGWQSFASEKSLELGDFLIFKYDDGNCLFDVEIFGRSGCLREALSSNMTTTDVMNGKEIPDEEICCVRTHTCKQKYSKKSSKRDKNLGSDEISRCKSRRNTRTSIGEGKELKAGVSIGDDKALKAGTSIGNDKALKAATYVIPEGPYFVTKIFRWVWYVVYVPRSLLDSYGIKIKPEMVLLDHSGKKWPVKVNFRKDGRVYINHGWAPFRKEHNLQIGDSCVFEIILGKGNSSQKIRVQIIRS